MTDRRGGRRWQLLLSTAVALLTATACAATPSVLDPPLIVGVVTDAPGLNEQEPGTNQRTGFEVDFYRWLGQQREDSAVVPTEVDVVVRDRETVLQQRSVDVVVATYSITEERDRVIDFAGPYLETRQGVMIRAGDAVRIGRPEDLVDKSVCAQTGSTSVAEMPAGTIVVEQTGLGECVDRLRAGDVTAVSTDQLLLYGYAQKFPGQFTVLPLTFGALQKYGIGIPPEAGTDTCEELTALIAEFIRSKEWQKAFAANFGDTLDPDDYAIDPGRLRPCVADDE